MVMICGCLFRVEKEEISASLVLTLQSLPASPRDHHPGHNDITGQPKPEEGPEGSLSLTVWEGQC